MFGRPIPDSMRCKALRRNCDCGYNFSREDDEKAGGRLMECPECGSAIQRCKKPSMRGTSVCRSHGAKGILKKAFIPTRINLDDEEIQALKAMIEAEQRIIKSFPHRSRGINTIVHRLPPHGDLFGRPVLRMENKASQAVMNPVLGVIVEDDSLFCGELLEKRSPR